MAMQNLSDGGVAKLPATLFRHPIRCAISVPQIIVSFASLLSLACNFMENSNINN